VPHTPLLSPTKALAHFREQIGMNYDGRGFFLCVFGRVDVAYDRVDMPEFLFRIVLELISFELTEDFVSFNKLLQYLLDLFEVALR
jgi:hypothetical protein